jgi:hypothetical protein
VVADAIFGVDVACGDIADGFAGLPDEDAAGGEGLPVADALDVVFDRYVVAAGAEEVGVQRVQRRIGSGAAGGERCLTEDKPSKEAPFLAVGLTDEPVLADALNIERADEAGDDVFDGRVLLAGGCQLIAPGFANSWNLGKCVYGIFPFCRGRGLVRVLVREESHVARDARIARVAPELRALRGTGVQFVAWTRTRARREGLLRLREQGRSRRRRSAPRP